MIPLGPDWKRLLDHLTDQGRLDDAAEVLRAAEGGVDSADGRAMIELERAALHRRAGRTVEADAAAQLAAREFDALSAPLQVRVELARAEVDARRDPIEALKRAHAADRLAVGLGPPHLRLATLGAMLEYVRRAGIRDSAPGLADMVIEQAGFTRDAHLKAAARTLRAEVACETAPPAEALSRARDAHAEALRLAPGPTRGVLVRRAAAIRGRAARIAGETLEAIESFEEAVSGPQTPPAWIIDLALVRQAAGQSLEADAARIAEALEGLRGQDPGALHPALGALLLGEGQIDDARRVAEAMPDGPLRLGLEARIALLAEQPEPTRAALKAALDDAQTPADARPTLTLLLASLHTLAGDRVDAIECLDDLLTGDGPDDALAREARIQRARLLTRFADYDDAFADANRAWDAARAAHDARATLHAGLVRAACLLAWDREQDAFESLSEAVALADRLGAGRAATAGRLEQALIGLSHGVGDEMAAALDRLVAATGAEGDRSARLRLLATLAIARHAADEGDADRARAALAGLEAETRRAASRLGLALSGLLPDAGRE